MAEHLGHDLEWNALGQEKRRARVAQLMWRPMADLRLPTQLADEPAEVPRVDESTKRRREHESTHVTPLGAKREALFFLSAAMSPQILHERRR